ncbi:MAG: fimbria/pilus periplasmic chaperone [Sphingomonadales bacterium]|nr:fimbria/pilus periplasmic chaperone [Sphingomonadales bacterium]MDE2169582.1 fimbria/pilus periplasmic chaperone [Sphingomonadales bacterium]
MTVQPVVINLQTNGRGMSQIVTVENSFATPLPVELTVQQLELGPDGVKATGKDPGDLLVFPPQALIQPGQTQTFRVQYVGDPDLKTSRHYYITVAQLPVKLPQGQSAIQILYNFQVLVSVAPNGAKPEIKVTKATIGHDKAGKPVPMLTVTNSSVAHGYLSDGRLRIVEKDAAGKEIFRRTLSGPEIQQTMGFGLVGANQTRSIAVPVELPAEGGSVEATFNQGG